MLSYAAVEERARKIVDTARKLAERGGFEAVRLRDVASNAEVALGTLYKRFRSKEDLLVAALDREVRQVERGLGQGPLNADTALERVTAFIDMATTVFLKKPKLAKAVLRALTSGDLDAAEKVARFHDVSADLITAALLGEQISKPGSRERLATAPERRVALVLQRVWFASLVGWASGLHPQTAISEQVREAAQLLLLGIAAEAEGAA